MANILGLGRVKKSDVDFEDILDGLRLDNPSYWNLIDLGKRPSPYTPKTNDFFYEDETHYYVPRYFYEDTEKFLVEGVDVEFDFSINLRNYQHKFFKKHNLYDLDSWSSFIMNVKTGHGKTVMGLQLMQLVGKKTLIVCETRFLMNQWIARMQQFQKKSLRISKKTDSKKHSNNIYNNNTILSNNKKTLLNIDMNKVNVCSLVGLKKMNAPALEKLISQTGLFIMDEGHRMGAKTFYPILEMIPAKRRILLTATLRRKDEMVELLDHSFEKTIKMKNKLPKADVYALDTGLKFTTIVEKSKLKNIDLTRDLLTSHTNTYETREHLAYDKLIPPFSKLKFNSTDEKYLLKNQKTKNSVLLKKFMSSSFIRRRQLITLLRSAYKEGRRSLVISPFLDLMYEIKNTLTGINTFILDGATNRKLKPDQLEEIFKDVDIILGSTKVVQEGMDVDFLDTLFIYIPTGDIEQMVGRVTRVLSEKKPSKVFYFVDNNFSSIKLFNNAMKFNDNFNFRSRVNLKTAKNLM